MLLIQRVPSSLIIHPKWKNSLCKARWIIFYNQSNLLWGFPRISNKNLFACQNVRSSVTVRTVHLKWTIQQTWTVRLAATVRTHFSIKNRVHSPNRSEHFLKNFDRKFSTGVILVDSYQQLKRIVICVKWNIDLVYFL